MIHGKGSFSHKKKTSLSDGDLAIFIKDWKRLYTFWGRLI
jgi:hypothetical protein